MPDPSRARDVSEFVRLLDEARINAGRPSYRTIAKRVGPLMRPPRVVAYSTVSDLFKVGRRRLDLDLVVAIVRSLGVAESEVARWREACVRVHADAKSGGPTGVFRQLPHDLSTFVGHERLLAELVAALTPRVAPSVPATAVAVVEGMAGVGKTQLAVHAAHALVRDGWYPDGQLYVNLRGFDPVDRPTDAATVLESFLRALEVPATQIPADPGERAAMFRDRVHDRRMLILLDNAADEDQVRDLIPAGPACRVLITSRRCLLRLDGAGRYVVEPFSAAEAVGLLARIAGDGRVAAEPEAARSVAARCGGLPLAVALSAARLRSRPLWTVADLDSRLRDGGLQKLGSDAVHHTVDLSYRHLAADTQSLFRALAAVPGPDFDVFVAAAVADLAASEAEALIEDLVDVHLVQQHLPGRYRMHDLVAAHSRAVAVGRAEEHDRAVERGLDYYLHLAIRAAECLAPGTAVTHPPVAWPPRSGPPLAGFAEAMAWLEDERPSLCAAIELAARTGRNQHAWRLPQALWWFLCTRGYMDDWDAANRLADAAAHALQDARARAHMAKCIGTASWRTGRGSAIEELTVARTLFHELGDVDAEAAAENLVGNAYNSLGNLREAVEHYRRSVELYRSSGRTDELYKPLGNIGNSLLDLGRYAEALPMLEEILDIVVARGIVGQDARARSHLGRALAGVGRFAEAATAFRTSADAAHRHGDSVVEALSLSGWALYRPGDHGMAEDRAIFLAALDLTPVAEHPETRTTVLNRYAVALRKSGDDSETDEILRTALELAIRYGVRRDEEISRSELAELHRATDPAFADAQLEQVRAIRAEMGMSADARIVV
ncbi:tetratricopeptide repeat protein [Kitasatospora acidiphila]|uniref:Tetratricopeptide repeat protein n=1 Tax=Kitasatospora acidiphila TaxID=2567942 RepID=A0A540VYB1_9ACTN|nr:tetratricopeptide repeat protein [Kitasatospora acidiphila]